MTTMDLKSISWVGDMYHRVESLCVEMGETMYQDTVKYAEEQMQTVEASVKKFYSDVMQDLLDPSSALHTVKEDLTLVQHADVAVSKKPKAMYEKKLVNTEAEQMVNDSDGAANWSVNNPYEPTSDDSVEEQCPIKVFENPFAELDFQNQVIYASKDLDNRGDSECKSPSDTSNLNVLVTEDHSEGSTRSQVQNESHEPLCGLTDVRSNSASVVEVSYSENDGVGIAEQMAEENGSIGVVNESETTSPSSGNLSPDFDASSAPGDIKTSFTSDAQNCEVVDLDLYVPESGTSNSLVAHVIENGEADKQGVLLGKRLDKVTLGESCILVEKTQHSFSIPLESGKKSYKKKIRDVFTSRRWAKGKQDQEQLALGYEEQNGKDKGKSSIKDSQLYESEWELL